MSTSLATRLHCSLLSALLMAGCLPAPQVETYELPRTEASRPALDPEVYKSQLDHILVAIVPQDETAWFFKLVGKAEAIQRQRQPFADFLATVRLGESPQDTPSWQLPEDWEEQAATAMRAATLLVPDDDGQLELAVSSLPLTSDWEEFLLRNVNRWLGQLDRRPLSQATILGLAQNAKTASSEATIYELSGVMTQRPMGSPSSPGQDPHAGLGIAPPQAVSAPAAEASGKLTYETPEGWQPGQLSMMRKAAFRLPGGDPGEGVTVTSFPATPGSQMADVAANVQRWAGQVGASVAADALEEVTQPIQIDGSDGTYVALTSPADSAQPKALHVAMIERAGQVWFFKLSGKRELVDSQSDAFREFLDSVKFP